MAYDSALMVRLIRVESLSDERLDYAILISLAMREDAEVMACALGAEGIDAFVGNRHHANVDRVGRSRWAACK